MIPDCWRWWEECQHKPLSQCCSSPGRYPAWARAVGPGSPRLPRQQGQGPGALGKALISEGTWKPRGAKETWMQGDDFYLLCTDKVKDWIVWLMGKQTSQWTARGFENPDFRGRRTTKGWLSDRQKPCKDCLEMERRIAQNSVQCKAIPVLAFPAICPSPNSHSTNRQLSSGATDSGLQVTENHHLYSLPIRGPRKGQLCFHSSVTVSTGTTVTTPHWVQTQLCKYRHNSVLLDYFFPHSTTPLL